METLIGDLTRIGLSDIEAKVYLTLLKKRNLTVKEISTTAKINRTQTYDILANLVKKGMCIEIFGNVKKYEAIQPEKVMNNIQSNLEKQKNIAKKLSSTLGDVFKNNEDNLNPLDFIKVLRTNKVIKDHVFNLISNAEKTICVFNKPPFAMTPDRNEPEKRSIKKGITHRSIYEVEADTNSFISKIKHFQGTGEIIRINKKLPLKLIIFDKRTVMMTLHNNSDQGSLFTAMSIEQEDFANSMADIFEVFWNNSITINEYLKKEKRGNIK
jgi:HTH-type transcriptional regulator, sugar sensing transcriptional regulator